MTRDTLLLVGREANDGREVLERHAAGLDGRAGVDEVAVATYDREPVRDLRDRLRAVPGDRVFVVPTCAAHDHHTVEGVPAALSYVDGDVRYCEPPGRSPAVTEIVAERGAAHVRPSENASLLLVGFGSSSLPFNRQAVEYHAARLRERSDFGEVVPSYLLQNPAVECARYNVTRDEAVAVPLFVARSRATEVRVPAELELDRGGIEYAAPLGDHPRLTDAIYAEFCKQHALATDGRRATFEDSLATARRPMAADGEGRPE